MPQNTCFIYWDPHPAHRVWAESVQAKFHSFVPWQFCKKNGIILHVSAFLKGLFLPTADVYLLESPMMVTAVFWRKLLFKTKVLAINSDPLLWELPQRHPVSRYVLSIFLRYIDGYLSTSKMMDDLAKKTNKPHTTVKLFLNNKYFDVTAKTSNKNMCFIGPHLVAKKGVDMLIDVFSDFNDERNLYLIGEVSQGDIQKKIASTKNIVVTGRIKNPEKYLADSGLYLNLARFEPAGINILEAMAAGIPPIVSQTCGFSSEVQKISPRLIVPFNKKKILQAILWLENSSERNAFGKKAKAIAREFTQEKSVADFKKKFLLLCK